MFLIESVNTSFNERIINNSYSYLNDFSHQNQLHFVDFRGNLLLCKNESLYKKLNLCHSTGTFHKNCIFFDLKVIRQIKHEPNAMQSERVPATLRSNSLSVCVDKTEANPICKS